MDIGRWETCLKTTRSKLHSDLLGMKFSRAKMFVMKIQRKSFRLSILNVKHWAEKNFSILEICRDENWFNKLNFHWRCWVSRYVCMCFSPVCLSALENKIDLCELMAISWISLCTFIFILNRVKLERVSRGKNSNQFH